mgnify:FL=1
MLIKILLKYIFGYVRVSIEGYYIERFINICTINKLLIWNLKRDKGTKLYLNIGIEDFYKAVKISKKLKCKIKIIRKNGIPFVINKYKKRKVFLGTLVFIILLIGISTNFIWNISIVVDGSEQFENIENDILEAGIKVGMKKSEVNIQETINKIRFKRNDISWMGIEIKGTNVIVKVVKSAEAPEVIDEKDYSNIIATKSATITKIIAQNGTAKVKNGDKVEEGQILIQGVMEGKYTGNRYVHSLGEVEGIVEYTKSEKIPLKFTEKVKTGNKETKIRIKINNFQINFYKTLSKFKIYDTIEKEKKFKIFSNLYLPISITKITVEELENVQMEYSIEKATEIGTEKLEQKLEQEIGKEKNILNKDVNIIKTEEYIEVNVTYEVVENIGMQEKIN